MKHIKKLLLFIVGVCVLIMAIVLFARTNLRNGNLMADNLAHWRAASVDQRIATAKTLMASEENIDLIVACVDKIANSDEPGAGEWAVSDAVRICHTGMLLKDNI